MIVAGCSTQENTARTRWWKAFNTRYNVYYNGAQAYIEASLEKENGNKDNYTELLPLYTVGNKQSRDLGKANYDKAIEKSQKAIKLHSIKKRPEWTKNRKKTERDIEWLNRKEYNPFMWKAWMLLGRSQFQKGAFDEAASTFSYMSRLYSTQPAIYGKARAWLAKCYIEEGWQYDAEDVITKIKRDSINWRAQKEWDYTYADYYLRTAQLKEAIPYLRKVIRHEMRRKQKAREWYIMGQVQAALGDRQQAYKAFKHVVRLNPPYELEFNARIAMTEVMANGQARKMVRKLKRMAASDNNKEYLDQVYYAIGNIYLAQKDTLQAIGAYEKGNTKSTRNGIEKGVLLLHLGDLYWQREDYTNAQRCYGEAIGLLDKDRKDYQQLSDRSKILDELVPFTSAVHLQDSLQSLAKMSEKDRNAAIDRVIAALKKKEKEEQNAKAEQEAQQKMQEQGGGLNNTNNQQSNQNNTTNSTNKNAAWYFYNPMMVSQGKAAFQKLWGKRENVDNWQRVNKTVVARTPNNQGLTDEQRDSIYNAEQTADSLKQMADSAQNDPHKREYYLAQIPFSEEQMAESNKILEDGLYHSGVIFKDKLDNLALSEKNLRRITDHYPEFEHMDDVYYHLYLLYSRKPDKMQAATYLEKLKHDYPESQWTALLSDPYFEENARYGVHLEDSLFAATYTAFKDGKYTEVDTNTKLSATRFPLGANRDKFIFIDGLSQLNSGNSEACLAAMEQVVSKYPESEVSPMAGMIINGVKAGRQLHSGKFDIGNMWKVRTTVLNEKDSTKARVFTAERNADFNFLLAYMPDSLNENQLLFELARYNFTNFMVRNFDIVIDDLNGIHRMKISGFKSYDEALQYARQLYTSTRIRQLATKARAIIISTSNLELLGTQYSYNDYDKFYEQHFVPLRISTVKLLTEPATIEYQQTDKEAAPDDNDLYNGGVIETNGTEISTDNATDGNAPGGVEIPVDNNTTGKTPANSSAGGNQGGISIEAEKANSNATGPATKEQGGITVTPEAPVQNSNNQEGGLTIGADEPTVNKTTPDSNTAKEEPQPEGGLTIETEPSGKAAPATQHRNDVPTQQPASKAEDKPMPKINNSKEKPEEDNGFYFTEDKQQSTQPASQQPTITIETGNNGKQQKEQNNADLKDEYYDLNGF